MSGFGSARIFLGIIHGLGWVLIAIAIWLAWVAINSFETEVGLLIAAAVAFSGLILVATAQIAMALIVTAENTGEMLSELRRLGNVSRAPAPQAATYAQSSPAQTVPPTTGASSAGQIQVGDTIKVFRGRAIVRASDGVTVGARKFPNVLAAEKYIDGSPD